MIARRNRCIDARVAAAEHDHGDNEKVVAIACRIEPDRERAVQSGDQFDGDCFGETRQQHEADIAEVVALVRHEARLLHDRNARFDDDFESAPWCVDHIN